MTKNIVVLDINNQTLGQTYIRRAKQLVKKRRAKWIDDTHIQLDTCPPYHKEDSNMNEDINMIFNETCDEINNTDAVHNMYASKPVDNLDKCVDILQKMSDETLGLAGILNSALDKLPEDQRSNGLKDILAIIEQTEITKRQIVMTVDSFLKIRKEQEISIAGKYENGRIHHKILEYYQSNGGYETFGEPSDNGGSEYVHKWGNTIVQDFDGEKFGYCNIMTGKSGTFLLKGVFRDKYLEDRCEMRLNAATSEEYETENGIRQDFEGGYMLYEPESDEIMVYTRMNTGRKKNSHFPF